MSVIFSVGMQSSASTWGYNIARELLLTRFNTVRGIYSDSTEELSQLLGQSQQAAVIKMHQPDAGLISAITQGLVPAIISIRDPRDSVVSLMDRFGHTFEQAEASIRKSITQINSIQQGRVIVFRYEDQFFNQPGSVAKIAQLLDTKLSEAEQERIFLRYSTESIRSFLNEFTALPNERMVNKNGACWDSQTLLHKTHLGDGQVGKWRSRLNPAQQQVMYRLSPTLQLWGYEP